MRAPGLFPAPPFLPPLDVPRFLAGQKVAVTGSRGVLGSIVRQRLEAAGAVASTFEGDVTEAAAVEAWLSASRPDFLLHLAARVPVTAVDQDPAGAFAVNAVGAFNVATALARHAPGAWTFFASTSHVYAPSPGPLAETAALEPSSTYGASKLAGELLVEPLLRRLNVACCVGRIFSFTHATQRPPFLVPSLRAAFSTGSFVVRSPSSVRDFLDAESVVDALLLLAERRATGVVNVGSGIGRTVLEIARRVSEDLGRSGEFTLVDDASPNSTVADVSRLRRLLGAS